jgi:hypothetical protein
MQFLKFFVPRTAVYLPADLQQWTGDIEVCDLDAGKLPTRSLELCDICVRLGVIDHLHYPELAIHKLSQKAEKILISYNSTDFSRQGLPTNRANAYSLSEIYAMLEGADFRIIDQRQYLHRTLIKAQSKRFDAASRHLRDERRAAFTRRKWTLGDEWARILIQVRTIQTTFQRA